MLSFWLKKSVSYFLMPLPGCLALIALGLLLLRSPRRAKAGRRLVIAGGLLLLFFSHHQVGLALLRPIEARYAAQPEFAPGAPLPAELAACRFIVVLGSGHGDADDVAAGTKLCGAAASRLMEGVRLARALPGAKIIVSGGAAPGQPSHAAVMAAAAVSLGIDAARIVRFDTARDTMEEADFAHSVAGAAPVALVTSASHMPRAAALLRKTGLVVVPCPTDFKARANREFRWTDWMFDAGALDLSTTAAYERLGGAWAWLRGKI